MLLALTLPSFGAYKGIDAVRRCAIFGGSPLQKAKKAGALCEIVRTNDWKNQPRQNGLVQRVQFKPTRDEQNLAKIKIVLESGKRWVAKKPSWLTRRNIQLDKLLPSVGKKATLIEDEVIKLLDLSVHGVKTLLQDENRLVRWYLFAAIVLNTRISHELASLELLDLSKGLKQTTPPRVIHSPEIRVEGLAGLLSFEPSRKMLDLNGRNIHGICCLPPGYKLAIIHSESTVLGLNDDENSESQTARSDFPLSTESEPSVRSDISWSYSFAKGLIALFQALYACATLYETRGDQIKRYGYAAFGLTVAPYLVMSIINLLGTILTPDYSTVFMVESEIMEEARQHEGARFRGAVGKLAAGSTRSFNATFKVDDRDQTILEATDHSQNVEGTPPTSPPSGNSTEESRTIILPARHDASKDARCVRDLFFPVDLRDFWNTQILTFLAIVVGLVSVAINGVLSHFKPGESTHAQRIWTMTWLAFGIIYGTIDPNLELIMTSAAIDDTLFVYFIINRLVLSLILSVSAVGGFVVVGQMLVSYGHCIQIGEASF